MIAPRWLLRRLQRMADRIAAARAPDFVIGGEASPYLRRWWVIPRNRLFNIYLHEFCRSDDDRALHDHPWLFNCSILLRGGYVEHLPNDETGGVSGTRLAVRGEGGVHFRWGASLHRVELFWEDAVQPANPVPVVGEVVRIRPVHCWTLFITGPRVREWGFACPQGWRHWRDFTAGKQGELVGKGCD